MPGITYAKSGVDIDQVGKLQKVLTRLFEETLKARKGDFGGILRVAGPHPHLVDIGGGRALVLHVDGVGTKVLIAQMVGRYDTVGVDCVAMNVNDVVRAGAEPLALTVYMALERIDEYAVTEISKGLLMGAKKAGVAVVGGETAILGGVVTGVNGRGFDLAAMCIGVVDTDKVLTGEDIEVDDVVIGLRSSGIHANGLTLARKILLPKYGFDNKIPSLYKTLGEELLEPTRIYSRHVLRLIRKGIKVHGLAHITGGGFLKLARLGEAAGIGFLLDRLVEPHPIFRLLQKEARLDNREMYRTFNMGVGFCVVVPRCEVDKTLRLLGDAVVIGRTVKDQGLWLRVDGQDVELT